MNNPFLFQLFLFIGFLFQSTFVFSQNSTCSTAITVTPGEYTIDTLMGEGAIFQGATAAAWYRFEPTQDGVFTVSSCGAAADTRLVILLLDDCEDPTNFLLLNSVEDNCSDGLGGETASTIEVVGQEGFSYVIYWDNGQSSAGFTWTLEAENAGNAKSGETCETAEIIGNGTHRISELTGVGTAFTDAVSAKWYIYTPERDGALFISSCESEKNTRLFVWGNGCPNKNILAQDDNSCGDSGASDLGNILVEKGVNYFVYWDDHYTKEGFSFDINVMDETTGLEEPEWAKDLSIYPNPAQDQVFINYQFPTTTDLQFSILNSVGQVVKTSKWTNFLNGKIAISIKDLSEGVYFLSFQTSSEYYTEKLFIHQN